MIDHTNGAEPAEEPARKCGTLKREAIHELLDLFLEREDAPVGTFRVERTNHVEFTCPDEHEGGRIFRVTIEQQVSFKPIEKKTALTVPRPGIVGPDGKPASS